MWAPTLIRKRRQVDRGRCAEQRARMPCRAAFTDRWREQPRQASRARGRERHCGKRGRADCCLPLSASGAAFLRRTIPIRKRCRDPSNFRLAFFQRGRSLKCSPEPWLHPSSCPRYARDCRVFDLRTRRWYSGGEFRPIRHSEGTSAMRVFYCVRVKLTLT
jgi:hypothetical protein